MTLPAVEVFNVQALEEHCKQHYASAESVIHSWGHIKRTAHGAEFFVRTLGGSEEDQKLAYIAGLLHDLVRPITEERCHAETSSEKAGEVLLQFPGLDDGNMQRIIQAVKDHRRPALWKDELHLSVYLADKILEHMGAYLDFRACVWAGELYHTDFHDMEPLEAILAYYKMSAGKFLSKRFPEPVGPLVDAQREWNIQFLTALNEDEEWAQDMATRMFITGKNKLDFEQTVRSFEPECEKQQKWKDEMMAYVEGEKWTQFAGSMKR